MKKRMIKSMLWGALALLSLVYVGCKDYDDDIDNLQTQIDANKKAIDKLNEFVNNGKWVNTVTPISGGFSITFSSGESFDIVNGTNGTNGQDGQDGQDGVDGKDGIAPVLSVGSANTWLVNAQDTQIPFDVSDYKYPTVVQGFWYFYNPSDPEAIAEGALKGYVKYGPTNTAMFVVKTPDLPNFVLNISDQEDVWNSVILPTAKAVQTIKLVNISSSTISDVMQDLDLTYGKVGADVKFNGVDYDKDDVLSTLPVKLTAEITPADVDFTQYSFVLQNSKGEAVYDVVEIKKHMSSGPLTKATETWDEGIYDLTFRFKKDVVEDDIPATDVVYALATKDAFGNKLMTSYNSKVKPQVGNYIFDAALTSLDCSTAPCNKVIKYAEIINKGISVAAPAMRIGGFSTVDAFVDYYIEDPEDPTITIDNVNKTIIATQGQTISDLKLHYLDLTGTAHIILLQVSFFQSVGVADMAFELQNPDLVPAPTNTAEASFNTSAGTMLDVSNDFEITKFDLKKEDGTYVSKLLDMSDVVDFSTVAKTTTDPWKLKGTFKPETLIPGEYQVSIALKDGSGAVVGQADFKLNITVADDVFVFGRKDLFFTDVNHAVAYGELDGANIKYDLKQLYGKMVNGVLTPIPAPEYTNIAYTEVVPDFPAPAPVFTRTDLNVGLPWLQSKDAEGYSQISEILVPQYTPTNNSGVLSERKLTVHYIPYGNENLEIVQLPFFFQLRSPIADGTHEDVTSEKQVTVSNTELDVDVIADFVWKDIKDAVINWYTDAGASPAIAADPRLEKIEFISVGEVKTYFDIVDTSGTPIAFVEDEGSQVYDISDIAHKAFKIKLKDEYSTTIQSDKDYSYKFVVTDKWGVKTSVNYKFEVRKSE